MLTALDAELWSNDCEVVMASPHNLRIYLIQKNASSSVRMEAGRNNWQTVRNADTSGLDWVDVFVREPRSRFLSGINTFVHHLVRDNPTLDLHTCRFLACRYLFLNRHYLPQWHWIANLSRFLDERCEIRLHHVQNLEKITQFRSRAMIAPMSDQDNQQVLDMCGDTSLWLLLDEILLGLCGQSLTWAELMQIYRQHPSRPLDIISQTCSDIARVLR